MQSSYRPGQWNLLVAPGTLVALSPEVADGLVTALWERLGAERSLAVVVDALTEGAGGSFTAMPPFAAVVLEGAHARVALRGDVRARVTGPDDAQTLSGANVTTWSEHFVPDVRRVALYLEEAPGAPTLPVLGGVVRAAETVVDIEPADAVVPAPEEAPAAGAVTGGSPAEGAIGAIPPVAATPPAAEALAGASVPVVASVPDAVVPEASPLPAASVEEAVSAQEDEPASADAPAAGIVPAEDPEASAAPDAAAGDEVLEESVTPVEPEASTETDVVSDQTLIPVDHTIDSDFDEFQQLFGDTVHVSPAAPPPIVGDHDGATISVAEARALRGELPPPPPPAPSGAAAPDAPTALIPTATGRVRVSTGQVVTLDRTVVIGRRPRAPRASGASLPHLIAVESPQQDISRSHLEIRPEGDTVVVVDLHTTNGSTLLRPGNDPVRLHPGEATLVLTGDVIDLGDGVTVAFEDLP